MGAVRHSPFPLKKKPFSAAVAALTIISISIIPKFTFAECSRLVLLSRSRKSTRPVLNLSRACAYPYFPGKSAREIPVICALPSLFLRPGALCLRYARADLDLRRQAFAQVFPDVLSAPKAGGMALHGTELTRWLRRLETGSSCFSVSMISTGRWS
jgi:hypothetical protein